MTFTDASITVKIAKTFSSNIGIWSIPEPRLGGRLRLNSFCGLNLASHALQKNNFYPSAWWKEFEGGWITLQPERKNPYEKELMSFCNNIIEGKSVEVNGEDGLKALEIIIASYIFRYFCFTLT